MFGHLVQLLVGLLVLGSHRESLGGTEQLSLLQLGSRGQTVLESAQFHVVEELLLLSEASLPSQLDNLLLSLAVVFIEYLVHHLSNLSQPLALLDRVPSALGVLCRVPAVVDQ